MKNKKVEHIRREFVKWRCVVTMNEGFNMLYTDFIEELLRLQGVKITNVQNAA